MRLLGAQRPFDSRIILDTVQRLRAPAAPGGPIAALDLRPLSLGELLDRTFFLYGAHFLLFAGIAAIPYAFFFVVNLTTSPAPVLVPSVDFGHLHPAGIVAAVVGGGGRGARAIVVGGIAFLFSVGATVFAVSEIYNGNQPTIRACLRRVRGKAGTIFGVLFLSGLLFIVGSIALIFPGIYLMCRISVATPRPCWKIWGPQVRSAEASSLPEILPGERS